MEILPLELDGKTGAEARRDGARAAHLVARLDEAPSRGRHAWVGLDDHSLADGESPDLLADVYAVAGDGWVTAGHLTHFVVVPAAGPLPELFFRLGFGQEQVHASAPTRAEPPPAPDGFTVRQATPDDLERLLGIVDTISVHQAGPPVWSGLAVPGADELHEAWAEFLVEDGALILLAEQDGSPVGYVGCYPADEEGVLHLGVEGTVPAARGRGIGVALAEHALHRAHLEGYASIELDWRSTNLLSSRFWPRRGFVPTHLRLRRDVQPPA